MILIILFIIFKNHQEHGEINIKELTDQIMGSVIRNLDILPISGEVDRLITTVQNGVGKPEIQRRKTTTQENIL
jgi:hypothetical protein